MVCFYMTDGFYNEICTQGSYVLRTDHSLTCLQYALCQIVLNLKQNGQLHSKFHKVWLRKVKLLFHMTNCSRKLVPDADIWKAPVTSESKKKYFDSSRLYSTISPWEEWTQFFWKIVSLNVPRILKGTASVVVSVYSLALPTLFSLQLSRTVFLQRYNSAVHNF